HSVVSSSERCLFKLVRNRSQSQEIECAGACNVRCRHRYTSRSIGQGTAGIEWIRGSILRMTGNDVVAVVCLPRVRKLRDVAQWRLAANNPDSSALSNRSRLPYLAHRICTVAYFLINILHFESPVATTPDAATHSILRVPLDHAVGDPQGIAALPVHSVAAALHGNIQMFQPTDRGESPERPGRGDRRVAHGSVAANAAEAQTRIQAVQQERLIIIDLHVTAKRSASQWNPGGNIEQPGFLCVHLDEGLLAIFDGCAPARTDQRNIRKS